MVNGSNYNLLLVKKITEKPLISVNGLQIVPECVQLQCISMFAK